MVTFVFEVRNAEACLIAKGRLVKKLRSRCVLAVVAVRTRRDLFEELLQYGVPSDKFLVAPEWDHEMRFLGLGAYDAWSEADRRYT